MKNDGKFIFVCNVITMNRIGSIHRIQCDKSFGISEYSKDLLKLIWL